MRTHVRALIDDGLVAYVGGGHGQRKRFRWVDEQPGTPAPSVDDEPPAASAREIATDLDGDPLVATARALVEVRLQEAHLRAELRRMLA
jgi:hypothetical protein